MRPVETNVKCYNCGHTWVSAWPTHARHIECVKCKSLKTEKLNPNIYAFPEKVPQETTVEMLYLDILQLLDTYRDRVSSTLAIGVLERVKQHVVALKNSGVLK